MDTMNAEGAAEYLTRQLYTVGRQNSSSANNFAVVRNTDPPGFTFYDHWHVNDLVEHENALYGLSSVDGNVYKLNTGFNADGGALLARYPVAALDHGAPLRLKMLYKIRIAGYITNNCQL